MTAERTADSGCLSCTVPSRDHRPPLQPAIVALILHWCVLENEIETPADLRPVVELFLQSRFRFGQNSAFGGFLARKFGQGRELVLQVSRGNSVPKAIFKRQDFRLFLFNAENRRVGYPDGNFVWTKVYAEILLQIETGFGRERAVKFDSLRAPRPGVEKFVFDFHLPREDRELGHGRRFLEINAAVDRDAWLQVRDFHESVPDIAPDAFQLRGALSGRAGGPALQPKKDDRDHRRADQENQRQRERPGKFPLWI